MSLIDIDIEIKKDTIEVGDRVRAVRATDSNGEIVGKEGTVIYIEAGGRYAVEFDTTSDMAHSCNRRYRDLHRSWRKVRSGV